MKKLSLTSPTLVSPNVESKPTFDQISRQFQQIADTVNNPSTGVTATRPLDAVVGDMFFDTTLGQPIWFVGTGFTGWVDATGASA